MIATTNEYPLAAMFQADAVKLVVEGQPSSWNCLHEFFHQYVPQGILHWDVDLRAVEIIDSCALGYLVSLHNKCSERKGEVKVTVTLESKLWQLLKLSRLDVLLQVKTVARGMKTNND